ncbi:MAG: fibronectin type III domain-containing protein [Verrucomicrobia bacterium]|nr:fibronectin type III domain-containing protein [Verrucomicrobiota bacterium]
MSPDTAVISWETAEPCEGIVEFGIGDQRGQQVREPGLQTIHRISLGGLEPKARYQYRIVTNPLGKTPTASEAFELDNALNYAVAKVPDGPSPYGASAPGRDYREAAEQILSATGITRGYCLILDCQEGQLAYELAKRSELIIMGLGDDRQRISRGRTLLRQAGAYGSRITLRATESLASLPIPRSFANLIVVDASLSGELFATAALVMPLLQPATGVAYLGPLRSSTKPEIQRSIERWRGDMKIECELVESKSGAWLRARREPPPDTGSWTHQYGDAGNSANSHEGPGT